MATDDYFRARLDQMIDLRHPLVVLAGRMPWSQIEMALAPCFARKNRQGLVNNASKEAVQKGLAILWEQDKISMLFRRKL